MRTDRPRSAATAFRQGAALIMLGAGLGTSPRALHGQTVADAADWPAYNRDLAGTRHSPLTQINRDNVQELREVWAYALGRNVTTGDLGGGSQFTPLVVDGVLYVAAADHVAGLDAATGRVLWRVELDEGAPSRRGMAYWPGDDDHPYRLYITAARRLIALSPATGDTFTMIMPTRYDGAPLVYGNLIIVGSNGAPGSVTAFDAITGTQAWQFRSTPQPGEPGHETWLSDAWRNQPNLFHWAFSLTLDSERGLLYAAFESPGPLDYYGGDRPGDNLFGDSIVALEVATGERRWHYQTVHHDLWDFDLPAPPGLLDVEIGGESVPVLALAGKTGYMYILNRETGEPVHGIEEVRVPASNVPGEQASPTQPIPVKPPPIAKVEFRIDDIVTAADTTAEHAAFCRDLYRRSGGFDNAGPFTPFHYRAPGTEVATTIVFPGSIGGANWGGTASDPSLGYVYVNTMDEGSIGWIEQVEEYPGILHINSVEGRLARFWWNDVGEPGAEGNATSGGERAWPCNKPPWASLVAVDAASGEIAWKVPLGITEELPANRRRTGRLGMGGPITTAGGLVFIGATNDRRFRAFDSATGEELWVMRLAMSAFAVPITYADRSGRQYVAVVAAAASALDDPSPDADQRLVVFALPD
jgi:quinoprotein glucose dehydrogenase